MQKLIGHAKHRTVLFFLLLAAAPGCATMQPPNAGGARGNEAPYPVLFAEDSHRKEATVAAVNRLLGTDVNASPDLQPITATIETLPANPGAPLYLPKLGAGAVMTEEETRESLRRFIKSWQGPIGADPVKLSLVERVDQPDGSKIARYEQRAFRYPLRGNYGKLEIRFGSDRRVLNILSTCIPDADKIQTALTAVTLKLKPEDAITQLLGTDVQYSNSSGNKQTFRPTAANQLEPRELVIFITPSETTGTGLAFHVAWQITLTNAPLKSVYLDAVTGEVVGTESA